VYETYPDIYPNPLVWADLPINVTSRVNVTGKWKNTPDEAAYVYHVDAWGTFNPSCDYEVGDSPSFTYKIIEGKDIDSH